MSERPDYIRSGGNVIMHAPLQLKESRMYGFFVRGKRAKLQQTIDTTLNAPAVGRMHFKVLSPYVMLTFTRVQHANSADPADVAKGWGQETDIVTWVLVGGMLPGSTKIDHFYAYPCHIFVNDCMALINGRELYGYPKYACEYTMPAAGEPPLSFTLAAKGFQPFSPTTELALHPLLEVRSPTSPDPIPLPGLEQLAKQAIEVLASDVDALDLDLAGWEELLQVVLAPQVDQLFLKQFPDGSGTKAVYQAVVAAPAVVKKLRSVALLGGDYRCNLHPFASFPLDETLGFALGEQAAILPFHLDFDFEVGAARELVDNSRVEPKKVAILGGGVSAITAAYYLSDQPGWRDRYDITVYQMGWRLGGKGASGRNAALGERIEEHGLHVWFGFYDNAFHLMQQTYGALERPPGAPLATWQEAFKSQHFVALTEWIEGQWKVWPLDTPMKPGVPGHGHEDVTLWDMVATLCEWAQLILSELHVALDRHDTFTPVPAGPTGWIHRLAARVGHDVERLVTDARQTGVALQALVESLSSDSRRHDAVDHALMHDTLVALRAWLHDAVLPVLSGNDIVRRAFICLDLSWTMLIGLLEDGVFARGFDVINDIDLRDWLAKHGANVPITVNSALIRGVYDLVFAFEHGDVARPNLEAGTAVRGMFRMAFAYHGGMMWKMQAGMGDTVFSPLYQLLKARGVKFEFFNKVEELVPAADGAARVDSIRLTQQVELKDGQYRPLVDVKGLASWPSAPDFSQIVPEQALLLREHDINLESNWSDWPEVYRTHFGKPLPQRTLQHGRDFDLVVYGISVSSISTLCPQLLPKSPALAAMCGKVKTVATQAYQVWLDKDLKSLGWQYTAVDGQAPVLSAFTEPFDTWAPMDQLLVRENWPAAFTPKNVSYFCSVLPIVDYPPYTDHGFPARCAAEVKAAAMNQLQHEMYNLWPAVAGPDRFDWERLIDPLQRHGEQRFDAQYWRANVDPSERYVLSVVGSTAYRLATDASGFANLYLTGDWIRTGLNAGCVEASVMAGMQTSRAISGWPEAIRGESDL